MSNSLQSSGLDYSPPCSSVHGISQARILEWVVISSPRGIFPTQGSELCLLHFLHWQANFFSFFFFFTTAPPGKPLKQTDKHTNKDSVVLNAACGHPGPRAASLQLRPLEGELWSWHWAAACSFMESSLEPPAKYAEGWTECFTSSRSCKVGISDYCRE